MPSPPPSQHSRPEERRESAVVDEYDSERSESSSSVGEEAVELLANCLSSPDPTDITEGLKALEALLTRHRTLEAFFW